MADDFDVEEMLEAPFKKDTGGEEELNGRSPEASEDEERHKKKSKHRRRHHSRSRSRSGSRSPRRKRKSRSGSPSGSRSPRRRHKRRTPSRERRRDRDGRRSRDDRRRHSKSRSKSRERKRRSRSRDRKSRRSRSRERPPQRPRSRSPERRRPSWKPSPPPMYKRVGGRSPEPELPSEDKDRRTVMCMQLAALVGPRELEDFFQKVGQVKEVKMIADKNSRRSKGIAYVEFHDEKSVNPALMLSGQRLFGVPIIVQPTMAEKNRLAAQAQNLMKKEGPRKLYVGSLDYNITEDLLSKVFQPFGDVEKVSIQKDENGLSKGFGFVDFKDSDAAERALSNLNGFELLGRALKVNHVTEREGQQVGAMEVLDSDDFDAGIGMTKQSRAQLMAKLAVGHNAGLNVPSAPNIPAVSACFMLSNMFDPSSENETGWENDIRDDVLEECMTFGNVLHIHVDPFSQGNVYIKCANPQVAASASNSLNGRFFAGKQIIAQFIPETTYHLKFPAAVACVDPLKPSS